VRRKTPPTISSTSTRSPFIPDAHTATRYAAVISRLRKPAETNPRYPAAKISTTGHTPSTSVRASGATQIMKLSSTTTASEGTSTKCGSHARQKLPRSSIAQTAPSAAHSRAVTSAKWMAFRISITASASTRPLEASARPWRLASWVGIDRVQGFGN
jgi:hypothetical protein